MLEFGVPGCVGAHDVERTPGEHAGDGIQVRCERIATNPGCLKGDGAATGKGVPHARPSAIAKLPQLLYEFVDAVGIDSKVPVVSVHTGPDRLEQPCGVYLLRPFS